ncbi:MAG TPA: hypothetical protein VGV69_05405 [Solirubrobacterales bacterium]|nr:hypothetical protein [Solirubrobacterales bacterium]
MRVRRKRIAALAVLLATCLLGASLAHAELTERGDLFVKFDGGIVPDALPRHARAPITVNVEGTIKTLSGERPPALRQIAIAINRGGSIDTKGLPLCRRAQLEIRSTQQALRACRPALVGHGHYVGALALPEQTDFPLRGRIVAFNAIVDGQRAILAHVFGSDPIPTTRIVTFRIRRSRGTFGTVFVSDLPRSLNRHGYLKQISLSLHRNFVHQGRPRSYLGAACAAPAGFSVGIFAFARVSMTFSDGRKLASTLIRSCQVRE